jgi:hypothetical protein
LDPRIGSIDWVRLTREFLAYEIPSDFCAYSPDVFQTALLQPLPRFVQSLLERRAQQGDGFAESARALYAFLLEKRYEERLNLLHFAFSIFDEESCLPDDIVARTPFPHEDGVPSFRYHGDANSVIVLPEDQA